MTADEAIDDISKAFVRSCKYNLPKPTSLYIGYETIREIKQSINPYSNCFEITSQRDKLQGLHIL
jgi:hypothetical protein